MSSGAWDLELELLCLPACGGSVHQTQKLAARIASACAAVPEHVVELANLSKGSSRERDLHRWVKKQPWRQLLPPKYEFALPYTPDGLQELEIQHGALLPHETFSALSRFPELFEDLLTGPDGNLQRFWANTSSTRWFQKHPLPELHSDPSLCVPIGIHGDDAGVFGSEKVLVLTWCSVARDHVTLDSRILFSAVLGNHCVPLKTVETLYKVFAWSLNCLASGEFPAVDHNGVAFSKTYMQWRFARAGLPLTQCNMRGVCGRSFEVIGSGKRRPCTWTNGMQKTMCVISAEPTRRLIGCGLQTSIAKRMSSTPG